jgi:hypothetical protein
MRWRKNEVDEPPYYDGQERVINKFALFPIYCENGEIAWLEKVNIKQKYKIGAEYIIGLGAIDDWINMKFV